MADEIRFPDPLTVKKEPGPTLVRAPEPTPRRTVVHRTEVPFDRVDRVESAPTKLSHDEMRALLAVHEAVRPTPARRSWRRGRVLVFPLGLFDLAAHAFLGDSAPWIMVVVTIGALVWIARPLFARNEFA